MGRSEKPKGGYDEWKPRKHPDNPVIPGTSRNFAQAYPPSVVRVNGRYYAIVKSWPDLVGFSSDDGVHWHEDGVVLTPGPAAWDENKLSNPLLRYAPDSETYHLYYTGIGSQGAAVGRATSDRPTSGYEKDSRNPIYDGEALGHDLGIPAGRIQLSDLIRIDGEFLFYGTSQYPDGDDRVWMGRGDDWTDVTATTVLFDEGDDDVPGEWIQTPQVVRHGSTYLMQYTAGRLGHDVRGEREIHAAYGDSYDEFTPRGGPVLMTGSCGSWDERRVYAAQWLKAQDGEYLDPIQIDGSVRLYYSGHDLGTSKLTGNLGLTGLAEYSTFPRGQ